MELNPYTYSLSSGVLLDYATSFSQCLFTVNDQNLFAANATVFTEHMRLWGVKGIQIKGCSFHDSTNAPVFGRRGIFTENAGFIMNTYCDVTYTGCECPENYATYNLLSGFTTAVETKTTGNQHPITVNEAQFSNNAKNISIYGNQFATVTRNVFDLSNSPFIAQYVVGLELDNCTGYKVEGNTFLRSSNHPAGTAKGVSVLNSTTANNTVYRNTFQNLDYGIYASKTNGNMRKGLQMLCNTFVGNGTDIYVEEYSTVSPHQGSSIISAGNIFDKKTGIDIANYSGQNINYYYTGSTSGVYYPSQYSGLVTTLSSSNANPCTSTLCNNNNGGSMKSLTEFQSDMDADSYYESVRALMADSVLDLNALEQWHAAAQPIADPYSLTETRFMLGYDDLFAADADDTELANYADFHSMKLALRNAGVCDTPQQDGHINWYALTPAQIAQLQVIAERNAGRASVMAKGVLCFFHGICYDDDSFVDDNVDNNDNNMETRSAKASPQDGETRLNVYPNPTDDLLYVELSGAGIQSAALFDLQGRVVTNAGVCDTPQRGTVTVNVRSIPAGVYLLRVTDTDGKEYHQKIVKR